MATPANNSGLQIIADRRRTSEHDIRFGEADGDDVTVLPTDRVRVKISGTAATPLLEILGGTPTSNGSSCTNANPTRLRLDQGDLTFPAGIYDIEANIVDASDSNKIKKAERGVLHLRESLGGNVGLTN